MPSATDHKEQGNKCFAAKDFEGAVAAFTAAIKAESKNEVHYSNRSAAYAKLEQFDEAIADAKKCVEMKPEWAKGYLRHAAALYQQKKYADSIAVYAAGIAKDPTASTLMTGMQAAQKAMEKAKAKAEKKRKKKGKAAKKGAADDIADDIDNLDLESKSADVDSADPKDHVIGIDLGTTFSCVGVWQNDGVHIVTNDDGEKTIPSYVSFIEPDLRRVTGHQAKNQAARNPKNTIYDIKRIIGQRFTDQGVSQDINHFPFQVVKGKDDKPMVQVKDKNGKSKQFAPEQISAMVLATCKQIAEKYLKEDVHKAVITVPAYFNDAQRNATKAAGIIAGLEVMRIINEPTAAALSYGLDTLAEKRTGATKILIFDLGGGTFDVSILSIENGVFSVVATGGDTRLGGEDFDQTTVDFLLGELDRLKPPGDARKDARIMQRLRTAAEAAKRQLSNSSQAQITIENLFPNWHFNYKLSRSKFEAMNKGHFSLCLDVVKRVLKDAKLRNPEIDEIVLVGGSTRIPKLQALLSDMFDGKTLCKSLNPDEAVAYGAAVQGAILNGKRNSKTKDMLLMDVTPLSLGIETTGRVMSVIIPRNTPIPCVKTQVYTTEANYQTSVDVSVYEGERLKSDENNLLGEFTISGIESAKRGEPQVDVSFSLDSDGILNVKAVDRKTGSEAKIEIANRSKASNEDIERMVAEAENYATEDRQRVKKIETRNELETTINELLEAADELDDGNLAATIREAAEKEQEWLDDGGAEDAKVAEIALRRRNLSKKLPRSKQ